MRVKRTSVSSDANGFGLYAVNEDLPRGSFVGVYTAENWRWAGMDSAYRGTNDYVMQVGSWRASPKTSSSSKRVNVFKFKVMVIQEPPKCVAANCQFMYFSRAGDIGADVSKSKAISCVAAYTTSAVAAGSELYVHYGDSKKRDYEVGLEAPLLYKKDINESEYPNMYALGFAPREGWRPRVMDQHTS